MSKKKGSAKDKNKLNIKVLRCHCFGETTSHL